MKKIFQKWNHKLMLSCLPALMVMPWVLAACKPAVQEVAPITSDSNNTNTNDSKPSETANNSSPTPEVEAKNDDSKIQIEAVSSEPIQEPTTDYSSTRFKYVALGDSVAAGYNGDLGSIETSGRFNFFNKAQAVEGWSYPSFFANYIHQTDPDFLGSYDNIALSGSTIKDWLYFLQAEKVPNFLDESRRSLFANIQANNEFQESPYVSRLPLYFGSADEAFTIKGFQQAYARIKAADLITISLGANDLFTTFSIKDFFQNSQQLENVLASLKTSEIFRTITNDYAQLVKQLQEINPQAKIVLVSYPQPLLRLSSVIEEFLATSQQTDQAPMTEMLLQSLNNAIEQVITQVELLQEEQNQTKPANKLNYVDIYNKPLWIKHAQKFAHNLFDIHPTMMGQKMMGLDLFLKLSINPKALDAPIIPFTTSESSANKSSEIIEKLSTLNPFWSSDYLLKDWTKYSQIFDFSTTSWTNEKLMAKYVGTQTDPIFLNEKTNNENNADLQVIEKKKNWIRPLRTFINSLGPNAYVWVKQILQTTFLISETQVNGTQQNSFDELDVWALQENGTQTNFEALINFGFSQKIFTNLIKRFLENLDQLGDISLSLALLTQTLKTTLKTFFQDESVFLDFITTAMAFQKSDLFLKNKADFLSLFAPNKILNNFLFFSLKEQIVNFLPAIIGLLSKLIPDSPLQDFENPETLQQLITKPNFASSTQQLISDLINLLLNSEQQGNILTLIPNLLENYLQKLKNSN